MGRRERSLRARDVFHMPQHVDGFTVVRLLRALGASPLVRLSGPRKQELQVELHLDDEVRTAGTLLSSTLIYSTLLYSTLLYFTLLYSTLLYSTLLYYTILYYTILYYTILLYYTTPHYTTLPY